jgi:hypothetical protein
MNYYESMIISNLPRINSIESSLRSLTWILPGSLSFFLYFHFSTIITNLLSTTPTGRFKDAELASEAS